LLVFEFPGCSFQLHIRIVIILIYLRKIRGLPLYVLDLLQELRSGASSNQSIYFLLDDFPENSEVFLPFLIRILSFPFSDWILYFGRSAISWLLLRYFSKVEQIIGLFPSLLIIFPSLVSNYFEHRIYSIFHFWFFKIYKLK